MHEHADELSSVRVWSSLHPYYPILVISAQALSSVCLDLWLFPLTNIFVIDDSSML